MATVPQRPVMNNMSTSAAEKAPNPRSALTRKTCSSLEIRARLRCVGLQAIVRRLPPEVAKFQTERAGLPVDGREACID